VLYALCSVWVWVWVGVWGFEWRIHICSQLFQVKNVCASRGKGSSKKQVGGAYSAFVFCGFAPLHVFRGLIGMDMCTQVLFGANLTVPRGTLHVLVGPNGCGKVCRRLQNRLALGFRMWLRHHQPPCVNSHRNAPRRQLLQVCYPLPHLTLGGCLFGASRHCCGCWRG
jgi:hypothetical protein